MKKLSISAMFTVFPGLGAAFAQTPGQGRPLPQQIHQTVELTGTIVTRNGNRAFRSESVNAVCSSCESTQ